MISKEIVLKWGRENNILLRLDKVDTPSLVGLERVKTLLGGQFLGQEGGVLQAKLGDRLTLFACINRAESNAYADAHPPTGEQESPGFYCCVASNALFRSLWWLCLNAWSSPSLLDDLGRLEPNPNPDRPTAIPRGLELLWYSAHLGGTEEVPAIQPAWLEEARSRMDPIRLHHAQKSFRAACDYVWLHEIAHILHGHVDRSLGNQLNHHESASLPRERRRDPPTEQRRAMEIEADRWAMLRIFEGFHKEALVGETCATHEVVTAALGVSLTHILFYASRLLHPSEWSEEASTHPPLWFRTDDILRLENLAAHQARQWFETKRGGLVDNNEWELGRIRQHCHLLRGLFDLANTHPLIGQWLGPMIDESRTDAAEALAQRAREALRGNS